VAPASADHHCGGDSRRDRDSGVVIGWCVGSTPGQPPQVTGYSEAQLWARWCADRISDPYNESFEVYPPSFVMEITNPETIARLGFDPTGVYGMWEVTCHAPEVLSGGDLTHIYFVFYEITPPVPVEVLRDRAVARIEPPLPELGSSPPFGERPSVVQLPTWLWVNGAWEAIQESETSGFVTVEVVAVPLHVDWSLGGGHVRCEGPGIPWSPAADAAGTYCQHTFTSTSSGQPDGEFAASATVAWELSWFLNGRDMGTFGTLDRTTGFEIAVTEIQAVETGG
jgi:hypothetical protein